jgi:GNAT superfamily N-acetyltransferase
MQRLVKINTFPPSSDEVTCDDADAHWAVLDASGALAARCSLWWTKVASHHTHRLGMVGHYAARDAASAHSLLTHACTVLAGQGCSLAVGPMDGNTWRRYRFVTDRGTEPSFFMEPDNPDHWPSHFIEQGFSAFARYRSSLNQQLARVDPHAEALARRLEAAGVAIRPLDPAKPAEELDRIYTVSVASFGRGLLYTPLRRNEFVAQYERVLPRVRPDLVLLAEAKGRPVGFVFAVPDWLQADRGQPIDTIVIKTVAVLPERAYGGLGRVLAWHCERLAARCGYTRSIHALMHDRSMSWNISREYARTIRRYTLFARPLP